MRFHINRDGAGLDMKLTFRRWANDRGIDAREIDNRCPTHRQGQFSRPIEVRGITLPLSRQNRACDQAGSRLKARREAASDPKADNGSGLISDSFFEIGCEFHRIPAAREDANIGAVGRPCFCEEARYGNNWRG